MNISFKKCEAHLPEGVIAVLAAIILFALPAGGASENRNLTWSDATRIDWGTILLFGGGMALGELMFNTGLAKWLGEGLAVTLPVKTVFTLSLLFAAVGVLVSETTSNTASATMITRFFGTPAARTALVPARRRRSIFR